MKKDLTSGARPLLAAADKGNAKAMHNLAVLYAEGIDGKPDYQTAAQWFRKAADHGVTDSQYNLGILYARGIGVEQNLAESYKWFALAAKQGDDDAAKKRDEVAARLDPQSLAAAKPRCRPGPPRRSPTRRSTSRRRPAAGTLQAAKPAPKPKPQATKTPAPGAKIIWAYSEHTMGTVFKIYLPCIGERGLPLEIEEIRTESMARGSETVLLVEDENAVRRATAEFLRLQGYVVLEAKDGVDALAVVRRHQSTIHLLVTDVVMPHMSGGELADELRRLRPEMRFLFVSGYAGKTVLDHKVVDLDANFLQKPYTLKQLSMKVRGALNHTATASGSCFEAGGI